MDIYITKAGDNLKSIAANNKISPVDIMEDNQIFEDKPLAQGEALIIRRSKKEIVVNGYVYPNINIDTLYASLPYLTYLSIFSYHATENGSLSAVNDKELIGLAFEQGTGPFMTITNMNDDGFSTDLAHTILSNQQIQNTLIENILIEAEFKGFTGINIDFEYIAPADKELYNEFIRKIAGIMHQNNYLLSTSLAPKTYKDQPGTLYEAHDYAVHGLYADYVILMTYEWGYSYGPPMAVAPVNQVERVISYAVSEIPSEKILMGIPNYGYDWTLPYVQGTKARSLSNTMARELAREKGVEIQFDEVAKTPYFNYNDGNEHVVWFEDARSLQAKYELVSKYNLGGISFWNLNQLFNPNFLVLENMYNIKKI